MLRAQSGLQPVIQPLYAPPIGFPFRVPTAEPFVSPAHPSPPSLRTFFLTLLNIFLLIVGFCLLSIVFLFFSLQDFYWTSVILCGASTVLIIATLFYIFGADDKTKVVFSAVLHLISISFFFVSIVIFLTNLAYHLDCNTWTRPFDTVSKALRDPTVKDCENVRTYSIVGGSLIQLVVMLQVISIYGTYNLRQRYRLIKEVQESQIRFLNGGGNN